jgi:hypothetical protein
MTQEEFISEFYSRDNEEEALKRLYSKLCCLKEENQELQKQLESKETQQKEFITYLEEPIRIITDGNPTNISEYTSAKLDTLEEILSKYKEIIGE